MREPEEKMNIFIRRKKINLSKYIKKLSLSEAIKVARPDKEPRGEENSVASNVMVSVTVDKTHWYKEL